MNASARRYALGLGIAVIGLAVMATSGFEYVKISQSTASSVLLQEVFKISLAFTFTVIGGAFVKALLDADAKHRADIKAKAEARQEQRQALIRELVSVFSGFYRVRKQYHSFIDQGIHEDASKREALLQQAVELEGRYGEFKVLALSYLRLPLVKLRHPDPLETIAKDIDTEKNSDKLARLWVDYLGQAFDDWRHGLEDGKRKIQTVDQAWNGYEKILKLLTDED